MYNKKYSKNASEWGSNMNKAQSDLLLRLFVTELVQDRDMVRISREIKTFEDTFGGLLPTWKADLQVLLRQHPVGYTSLNILLNWK